MFIFQIICFVFTIFKIWFEKLMKIFNEWKKFIDVPLLDWTSMPNHATNYTTCISFSLCTKGDSCPFCLWMKIDLHPPIDQKDVNMCLIISSRSLLIRNWFKIPNYWKLAMFFTIFKNQQPLINYLIDGTLNSNSNK
jgi:hypothetical protein